MVASTVASTVAIWSTVPLYGTVASTVASTVAIRNNLDPTQSLIRIVSDRDCFGSVLDCKSTELIWIGSAVP